jgi:hypothetical protein
MKILEIIHCKVCLLATMTTTGGLPVQEHRAPVPFEPAGGGGFDGKF